MKTIKQKIATAGTGDFQNKLYKTMKLEKKDRKKGNGMQKLENLKQISVLTGINSGTYN